MEGRVLGIDVGYSEKKATTGFCLLIWGRERVELRCNVARSSEPSRVEKLHELGLDRDAPVDAVATDSILRLIEQLLPGRKLGVGSFPRDHQGIAAFVCALTALCYRSGIFVAVVPPTTGTSCCLRSKSGGPGPAMGGGCARGGDSPCEEVVPWN